LGRASTPQVGLYHAQGDGVGPEVPPRPHPLADMDSSLTFASPVIPRYPLMLQQLKFEAVLPKKG